MTDLILDCIVTFLIIVNTLILFTFFFVYRKLNAVLTSLEYSYRESLTAYIQMRKEILKKGCTDAAER